MKDIVIIGAGGFGREVAWLIEDINRVKKEWNILGFVDDNDSLLGKEINGYKVVGNTTWLKKQSLYVVNAIGNSIVRKRMMEDLMDSPNKYPSIIHPSVTIFSDVLIGQGTILCNGIIVSTGARIGDFGLIHFNSVIGHDSHIGDYVTIFPSVNTSGFCCVEDCVQMGVKSSMIPNTMIGENSIIGAGAVVIKDIPANCTAVGIPARPLK